MEVKSKIEDILPDIVAVELDAGRLYGLRHKTKKPKTLALLKSLGLSGYLFFVVGQFIQQKLGRIVEIEPGSEMLSAVHASEEKNIPIALIDRDIQVTLSRFSRYFRKREVLRMIWDVISSPFQKNKFRINLDKVPETEVIDYVLMQAKKNYPSLYKILIHERDMYMANELARISYANPDKKILAVVGAGHVKGLAAELNKISGKQ
jgi:pheromone shutdown protein TraB